MSDIVATDQTLLVVGGGITGISAALEVAEIGKDAAPGLDRLASGGALATYAQSTGDPTCPIRS